jgi:ubiquinone/menaquinone biosynthesis C-methylase UbiE
VKYSSKEEAQKDHLDNYRSDGIMKGKGTQTSPDFYRVNFVLTLTPPDSYVLDVGCNTGVMALPLMLHKNCYVKGIDLVPEIVEKAVKAGIPAQQGEAEDLSRFKDNTFDVVICSEVLEHLYDPLPAIKEAYRVLKKGGKYIATLPAPEGDMCKDMLGDYHQKNYSYHEINDLFKSVFKEDNFNTIGISYSEYHCRTVCKSHEEVEKLLHTPQWVGIEAIK